MNGYRIVYARILDPDPRNFNFVDVVRSFMMMFDLWQYEEGTWPGLVFVIIGFVWLQSFRNNSFACIYIHFLKCMVFYRAVLGINCVGLYKAVILGFHNRTFMQTNIVFLRVQ